MFERVYSSRKMRVWTYGQRELWPICVCACVPPGLQGFCRAKSCGESSAMQCKQRLALIVLGERHLNAAAYGVEGAKAGPLLDKISMVANL